MFPQTTQAVQNRIIRRNRGIPHPPRHPNRAETIRAAVEARRVAVNETNRLFTRLFSAESRASLAESRLHDLLENVSTLRSLFAEFHANVLAGAVSGVDGATREAIVRFGELDRRRATRAAREAGVGVNAGEGTNGREDLSGASLEVGGQGTGGMVSDGVQGDVQVAVTMEGGDTVISGMAERDVVESAAEEMGGLDPVMRAARDRRWEELRRNLRDRVQRRGLG